MSDIPNTADSAPQDSMPQAKSEKPQDSAPQDKSEKPQDKSEKPPKFSTLKAAEKDLGENMGCAVFGLVLGMICLIAPIGQVAIPSENRAPTLNKWGIAGLIIGAPITALAGWGGVSSILAAKQARKKRLRRAFFKLLEQSEGRLTVMAFSRAVDIDGNEAKAYLNERAQEFNALFEPGTNGGITYFFDLDLQ